MFCFRHTKTSTVLSCSRCGQPICIDCLVQTVVGNRCFICSRASENIFFRLSFWTIIKVFLATTFAAVFISLIMILINLFTLNLKSPIYTGMFLLYGILIISGFIIGEVISAVSNHKRGLVLKTASIYGLSIIVLAMIFGKGIVFSDLLNMYGAVSVLLACFLCVRKF